MNLRTKERNVRDLNLTRSRLETAIKSKNNRISKLNTCNDRLGSDRRSLAWENSQLIGDILNKNRALHTLSNDNDVKNHALSIMDR